MKNTHISPELRELLGAKDDLCISLIVPMNEIPSMKKLDRIAVDHAIGKLEKLLSKEHDKQGVDRVMARFRTLGEELGNISGVKGIGVFASSSVFKIVTFPFEVQEKIYAGKSFEIRDVLFRDFYSQPYMVVSVTLDRVRLFRGSAAALTEVHDEHFPATFAEPEKEIPEYSAGTLNLTATTKKEMVLTMESRQAFLKAVDRKLSLYFTQHEPVFLAGVEKEVASFQAASTHKDRMRGCIHGSYNGYNQNELAQKSWQCMQSFMESEENKLIESLNELFGRELVSIGLPDVWRNARLGKGNILVVERDLAQPAFITGDGYQLWLSAPAEEHEMVSDAVDDLIETVLSMDGRVHFTANGKLKEFNGVAMIHRY